MSLVLVPRLGFSPDGLAARHHSAYSSRPELPQIGWLGHDRETILSVVGWTPKRTPNG